MRVVIARHLIILMLSMNFCMGLAWGKNHYEEPECMGDVQSDEDINICQYATAKFFELRVQELEEEIINRFSGVQLERFKAAQESWRALMENDCAIQSDFYEGARIYTAIISQCMQHHYRNRLEILENYLCAEHSLLNGCDTQVVDN